jgi:hypothetical protein
MNTALERKWVDDKEAPRELDCDAKARKLGRPVKGTTWVLKTAGRYE